MQTRLCPAVSYCLSLSCERQWLSFYKASFDSMLSPNDSISHLCIYLPSVQQQPWGTNNWSLFFYYKQKVIAYKLNKIDQKHMGTWAYENHMGQTRLMNLPNTPNQQRVQHPEGEVRKKKNSKHSCPGLILSSWYKPTHTWEQDLNWDWALRTSVECCLG